MSKPKQEINPKCSIRLHQICSELKITQKQLANASGVSENTLSKIMTGKSPLTQATAEVIIKACPSYRVEWLRGLDDHPHEIHILHVPGLEKVRHCCAVINLLKDLGITVGQVTDSGLFVPANCGFLFYDEVEVRKGTSTIWRGTIEEIENVLLEICEFSMFKIQRLCNKKEG